MRILLLLLSLALGTPASAQSIVGRWSGSAIRGGESRPIVIDIRETPKGLAGRYSMKALAIEEMPLPDLAFDSAARTLRAGHALQAKVADGHLTGNLAVIMLDGPPVQLDLMRSSAPPPPLRTREREVSFLSAGFTLKGTLVAPLKPGRYPAMVSLHGSGYSTRWFALGRARRFAEAGYTTLIYDKPGCGESGGDWTMESLDDEAGDAVAAADFLAAQPEADSKAVGLWGHSHAGWIIPRAAALSNRLAFAIALAGGGTTPQEVETYGYRNRLKAEGADPVQTDAAMGWVRGYLEYLRTGQGYQQVKEALALGREQGWGKLLGVGQVYPLPAQWAKWQWVGIYDPAADIRRMRIPVLVMFAGRDTDSPPEGLSKWRSALEAGGNRRADFRFFAEGDHHFMVAGTGEGWPSLIPSFFKDQIDWLDRQFGRKRR